jgi:ABC-type lipoprotein export system ATPase subunit
MTKGRIMARLLARRKTEEDLFTADAWDGKNLIDLRGVVKTFVTDAGDFTALKGIDLTIERGEFVGVIGKSGSGKSTLINMITGIDRPTEGEIYVGGTAVHLMDEGRMAQWRGRTIGIVFQFFQLLPTLTVIENVMLPMDFCNTYDGREREERARMLLDLMEVSEYADKLPTEISGGEQQRVAIARALANDPPILVADEPTGNLDSRTAEHIFRLFETLAAEGKTVLMVTHDDDQAKRVDRTMIIADGQLVNEWLIRALPTLSQDLMLQATRQLQISTHPAGEPIILQDAEPDSFFIITKGEVNIYLHHPEGREIYVETLRPGQYFGEMALRSGGHRTATVRASRKGAVEVVRLDKTAFHELMGHSEATRDEIDREIGKRRAQQDWAWENGNHSEER